MVQPGWYPGWCSQDRYAMVYLGLGSLGPGIPDLRPEPWIPGSEPWILDLRPEPWISGTLEP